MFHEEKKRKDEEDNIFIEEIARRQRTKCRAQNKINSKLRCVDIVVCNFADRELHDSGKNIQGVI